MKNLEQIRAASALACADSIDRQAVRKLPAMVLANGLLAAASFSLDSESRKGMRDVWEVIGSHLHQRGYLKSALVGTDKSARIKSFLKELAAQSSLELQSATTETMAFLGYLKRFTPKPVNEPEESEA